MCRKCIVSVIVTLVVALAAGPARAQLLGHWRLDEGAGTAALDASDYGNDGTLQSEPQWVGGVFGGALAFDGIDDYVLCAEREGTNPGTYPAELMPATFTVACWTKLDNFAYFSSFVGNGIDTGDDECGFFLYNWGWVGDNEKDFGLAIRTEAAMNYIETPNVYETNTWYHLASSYDGTNVNIYVNGELVVGPMNVGGPIRWVSAQSGNYPERFAIGVWLDPGYDLWVDGVIDDVRYYGRVLAEDEINGIMADEPLPKAFGPGPQDGETIDQTAATLTWSSGDFAASHNVYFGDSLEAVKAATPDDADIFAGNLAAETLQVGTADGPYPDGLAPGRTYYWRVDEVNDTHPNSPWKGDVWSFRVRPPTAWNPTPADGLKYVLTDQELTWEPGLTYILHQVHFGETFEEIEDATGMGFMTVKPTYSPPAMETGKTYYWWVDEFLGAVTQRGDVWSFTTVPDVAVTDPDLLGWWTLDEGMGTTAVDWSGHGHHGRILDGAQWTYGVHDGALYLAGGANVEIPALNVQTNTVTMTAWVKRDGNQADWAAILFSREGSTVSGMGFGPANELRYHWTDQYWDFVTGIVPPAQEWFFVALVVEPTQGTLYYNGTGTSATNAAAHDPDPFDGALRIGQDSQGGRDLKGTVDDVRFYNKTLSAAEIMEAIRGDPLLASDPTPAPDAVMDIRDISSLRWSAGDTAASHDVYLGASRQTVAAADKTSAEYRGNRAATSFSLGDLVEMGGGDYYWRIDEVETDGATIHTGYVWKFTIPPYLLVDDFESYTDNYEAGQAIWQAWIDGLEDPQNGGSQVGYAEAPFAETRVVHGGSQSMPLQYDNTTGPGYSETDRTFSPAQDWTQEGVTTLAVHFRGTPGNVGQLYAKINGTKVPYDGDPADIATVKWIAWDIDLASVGVNLTKVTTLTIGVEGGQSGIVYIDDIWLTKP